MRRFAWIALCVLSALMLSACNNQSTRPTASTPSSNDRENIHASTSTTTTMGALVVTNTAGAVVTKSDGELVTTLVATPPTTIRTVTDAQGTSKTEVVVMPHITVATDVDGTIHTSHVTEHTITSTATSSTSQAANAIDLPKEGYMPDNNIMLGAVSCEKGIVSIEVRNVSSVWESDEGESYFEYTCYDKNNAVLAVGTIPFGYIPVKSSTRCTFAIPENTVKVALTDFHAEYWSAPV